MKELKTLLFPENNGKNRQALRGGSYSLTMTAVVLAILVVANVFVSALPSSLTKYDISSSNCKKSAEVIVLGKKPRKDRTIVGPK